MVDTEKLPPTVDGTKLNEAVEWAFRESDPGHLRRTRAVVVVYDGKIVAERYAPGYNADTPLPGWSMTKSVSPRWQASSRRREDLSDSNGLLPQWRDGQDPRRAITLDNLLSMSSGLAFQEAYSSPLTDVTVMLLGPAISASFAADKPLQQLRLQNGTIRPATRSSFQRSYAIRSATRRRTISNFPAEHCLTVSG